jgi:hypothetical protein
MRPAYFSGRDAKRLMGRIAQRVVLISAVVAWGGVASTADAQPKDTLRYNFASDDDLTTPGGIHDRSGKGNNGTELSRGTKATFVPGHKSDSLAVYLGANGTGIDTGTDTATVGIDNNPFTVMAFVNRGTVNGDNMLFGSEPGVDDGTLHIGFRGKQVHVGFWGSDSTGPAVQAPFVWVHYAVRYDPNVDGGSQDVFINGTRVAHSGGHGPYHRGTPFQIGRARGDRSFGGAIDDARVFGNAALTADQINDAANDRPIRP